MFLRNVFTAPKTSRSETNAARIPKVEAIITLIEMKKSAPLRSWQKFWKVSALGHLLCNVNFALKESALGHLLRKVKLL